MKRHLLTVLALLTAAAQAATLDAPLPAYASPDVKAPILGSAKAGTRITAGTAPSGWAAVELEGPHTVYVTEKDTLKNYEVRPGAAYHSLPRADSPVLGLAGENDVAELADIAGRYNKFSLRKAITAYVRIPPTPVAPIPATPAPQSATAPRTAPAAPTASTTPKPDAPLLDDVNGTLNNDIPASSPTTPGQTVATGEPNLARTFFGVIGSTRSAFRPRRPYDFQLNDASGSRIAFLDVSKLLLTEQIGAFIGRPVALFGTAEKTDTTGEIVVRVETLKLQ